MVSEMNHKPPMPWYILTLNQEKVAQECHVEALKFQELKHIQMPVIKVVGMTA
jgi:hypothetical protein